MSSNQEIKKKLTGMDRIDRIKAKSRMKTKIINA
jgi:hypothetical protein